MMLGACKFVKRCKQTISIHQLMVGWFDGLFASLTWDLLDIATFLAKVKVHENHFIGFSTHFSTHISVE
jgi:hypothetical protein